jgi:hypothetical protein
MVSVTTRSESGSTSIWLEKLRISSAAIAGRRQAARKTAARLFTV